MEMKNKINLFKINWFSLKIFIILKVLSISISSLYQKESIYYNENDFNINSIYYKSVSLCIYNILNCESNLEFSLKDANNAIQSVILSYTDINCENDRKQMIMNPYKDIYINNNEIKNLEQFYICIQCKNEDNCNYEINLKKTNNIKLNNWNFYNYYVSEENTEINFIENIDNDYKTFSELCYNNYIHEISQPYTTVWIAGNYPLKANSNFINKYFTSFSNGYIYIFQNIECNSDNSFILNNYDLKVKANVGDYITIGSNIIYGAKFSKKYIINDEPEVFGYLKKNVIEKQCFKIKIDENKKQIGNYDVLYFSGFIYTKLGKIYFLEKNTRELFYGEIIYDGLIIISFLKYQIEMIDEFCITFLNELEENLSFSIKLTSHKVNQLFINPQLSNLNYNHVILKGEIASFYGIINQNVQKIKLSINTSKGNSNIYFDKCLTFPKCYYNDEKMNQLINLRNSIFIYDINKNEYFTPISNNQPILIVKCIEGKAITIYDNEIEYCLFQTSISTEKDLLLLEKNKKYKKLLLQNEIDMLTIDLENEVNIYEIYIELSIINGNISLEFDSIQFNKEIIINKIIYHIPFIENQKKIDFNITPFIDSYYYIQYRIIEKTFLESGKSYILELDNNTIYSYIQINNIISENNCPFFVNFYLKDCQSQIIREKNEEIKYLEIEDNYAQEIINNPELNGIYLYKIDNDPKNKKQSCIIDISSFEMQYSFPANNNKILIMENKSQYVLFNSNITNITYYYYLNDLNKNIEIDFNLINDASYDVGIYFDNIEFNNYSIDINNLNIKINKDEYNNKCNENQICKCIIKVKLLNDNNNIKLETIFRLKDDEESNNIIPLDDNNMCPINFPFYFINKGCVDECHASYFFKKECSINNEDPTIINKMIITIQEEISDESMNSLLINVITRRNNLIVNDNNIAYEITSDNYYDINNNNISIINLGECGKILKKYII